MQKILHRYVTLIASGFTIYVVSARYDLCVMYKKGREMNFEGSRDVAERISRIEQSLFTPSRVDEQRTEKASLADKMDHYAIPGVSIAVINQDRIEWAKGYGVRDTETQEPISRDTMFQAASISKPVTAVAVLRLVETGRLDLDEDVNAYLVSWRVPKNMSWQPRVTLRQLLCHSAGLTVHGFPGYPCDAELPTLQQVLDGQKPTNTDPIRVNALPGTQFRYSGGGYCVLQQMLMDVTGKPFPELMRELVLDPLGMKQSTFEQPLPPVFAGSAASGHHSGGKPVSGKWHIYPEMAAAGLWTTPSDLAHFALALEHAMADHQNSVLSRGMVSQMLTPQVEPFFGLGILLGGQETSSRFAHNGGNAGFGCLLEAYVQGGLGAVMMTNSDIGMFLFEPIMAAIAQEYHWPDYLPKERTVSEIDSLAYDTYVGKYELKPGFTFTVARNDNELFLQPTGQSMLALYPENETTYFLKEVNAEVIFVREDQKEVTSLTFKQNAREMAAKKMKE